MSPQNRAVLLARDPRALFVHWEIQPVRRIEALRAMGADGETAREVLRYFELDTMPPFWQDIEIEAGAERAYATVEPARSYRVEIGLRTAGGRFIPLAVSNTVTTPAAEPSPDTAVHWVVLETGRPPRPVAAPSGWEGQRIPVAATATTLAAEPAPAAPQTSAEAEERLGSSDQMPKTRPVSPAPIAKPAGPRASDALPLRPRASDALPLR